MRHGRGSENQGAPVCWSSYLLVVLNNVGDVSMSVLKVRSFLMKSELLTSIQFSRSPQPLQDSYKDISFFLDNRSPVSSHHDYQEDHERVNELILDFSSNSFLFLFRTMKGPEPL
jgi:hypothetical protein